MLHQILLKFIAIGVEAIGVFSLGKIVLSKPLNLLKKTTKFFNLNKKSNISPKKSKQTLNQQSTESIPTQAIPTESIPTESIPTQAISAGDEILNNIKKMRQKQNEIISPKISI